HRRVGTDERIWMVELIEGDLPEPEPGRARHRALLHDRCQRQEREDLRRDEYPRAVLAERLAEDALALPEPVRLGSVEERDAELESAANDPLGLRPGVVGAVTP